MTKEYQDLHHLGSEENDHQLRKEPPPSRTLLQRLCSSSRLLLLSLGLSFLLLVVICVIGSQNAKLEEQLQALRETFSNVTKNVESEVKDLSVQGERVGRKMKSLESQVEKQQHSLKEDHSSLLLHVKQFVMDLRSLNCHMAVLHGNASEKNCCPVNWKEYNGSCYWFSDSVTSWSEAENYCRLENAYLVVINSLEEQNFIQHQMGPVHTWIGLTDQTGRWKWVDSSDYEKGFKNWRPEQPDNWHGHGLGGGEDCAHLTDNGQWNDNFCQKLFRWVCEAARDLEEQSLLPDNV